MYFDIERRLVETRKRQKLKKESSDLIKADDFVPIHVVVVSLPHQSPRCGV